MPNKKPSFLIYNDYRIRLDSIVRYSPTSKDSGMRGERYGISFLTRDGDSFNLLGDDEHARDRALKFLDEYFAHVEFKAWLCENCTNAGPECEAECSTYDGYPNFKRKEEGHDT